MPETPNHDYNVPNKGQTEWHKPLNENFRNFERDVEVRDTFSNLSNYVAHDGAKYFATDSGAAYLGDGNTWNWIPSTGDSPTLNGINVVNDDPLGIGKLDPGVPLDVVGQNNWDLSSGDGDVRVGDPSYRLAIGVSLGGAGRGTARINAKGGVGKLELGGSGKDMLVMDGPSNTTIVGDPDPEPVNDLEYFGVRAQSNQYGGMYVDSPDTNDGRPSYGYSIDGDAWAAHTYNHAKSQWSVNVRNGGTMRLTENGDVEASGNKNFVQEVDTDDGEKEVVYTASEAPTPHTEVSGVAALEEGRAEVDLPDHFDWVTDDDEPVVVQITPYGGESGTKVVERSTDRVVVEDLDGEGDYEFAYTVKGTRKGQADKEVVREPTGDGVFDGADAEGPAPADD